MRLLTFIKRLFHRRKLKTDLASFCVLFGVSPKNLTKKYAPYITKGEK